MSTLTGMDTTALVVYILGTAVSLLLLYVVIRLAVKHALQSLRPDTAVPTPPSDAAAREKAWWEQNGPKSQ